MECSQGDNNPVLLVVFAKRVIIACAATALLNART